MSSPSIDTGFAGGPWPLVHLDTVAKRGSGHTPDKKHPEYWSGHIKWISLKDTDRLDRVYIDDTTEHITPAGIANSSAVEHPAGTVVLSRDAGVGKSAITRDVMAVSQHFMAWRCGPSLDNRFLYYWLQYRKPEFERVANGNTIKTIGLQYFRDLEIPLPSVPEQRAIAAALGDIDSLLDAIDRLIAKKRDVRQGAMQQLLTGRTRLPGFGGPWRTRRLGELGSTYGGLSGKTKHDFGDGNARYVPFLNVIANVVVNLAHLESVRIGAGEAQNLVRRGDVLFNASSETPEEVGMAAVVRDELNDVYLNSFCFGFRLSDRSDCDGHFLAYLMRSAVGRQHLYALAQGATRYNLSKSALLALEPRLPSLEEQLAIVNVLSEIDAELLALEQRREKIRLLKQGMMQEVLTGRTHLV